jgi:hypothetical protein
LFDFLPQIQGYGAQKSYSWSFFEPHFALA